MFRAMRAMRTYLDSLPAALLALGQSSEELCNQANTNSDPANSTSHIPNQVTNKAKKRPHHQCYMIPLFNTIPPIGLWPLCVELD